MEHQDYMAQALELARQAMAEGEVPVGCVIVRDGVVVGRGRNRRETARTALGHAEIEAIDQACRTLGACYEALGKPRHALRALLESLAFDPPRAEVCCDLGRLWMERNDYAQAARWYEQALDCPWDLRSGAFCIPDCHGFLPCIQLCVCAWNLGERERAVYWNERAAAFRPDHPACRQNRAFFASEMDSSQENASKREDSGK